VFEIRGFFFKSKCDTMIIAGNWKMNFDLKSGQDFINQLVQQPSWKSTVILCVPSPLIYPLSIASVKSQLYIGAQNCHEKVSGAFTGEVSAELLISVGCEYVILGHSERRQYYGESDELILQKIITALNAGLKPIYCCGEHLQERENNTYILTIQQQLEQSVLLLSSEQVQNIAIAYEPVWAIGTGHTASSEQAQEVHYFIRQQLIQKFGVSTGKNIPLLYGGSCNPKNANELFSMPDIDGGLIGGASLIVEDFISLIQIGDRM
jgi:triosephosphate isomerase (TIM)